MLPIGVDCPGCEDKEKEYFVSAGSKGMLNNITSFYLWGTQWEPVLTGETEYRKQTNKFWYFWGVLRRNVFLFV